MGERKGSVSSPEPDSKRGRPIGSGYKKRDLSKAHEALKLRREQAEMERKLSDFEDSDDGEPKPKRGRGRPKGSKKIRVTNDGESSGIKRGRGRPKKVVYYNDDDPLSTEKRKRGRPSGSAKKAKKPKTASSGRGRGRPPKNGDKSLPVKKRGRPPKKAKKEKDADETPSESDYDSGDDEPLKSVELIRKKGSESPGKESSDDEEGSSEEEVKTPSRGRGRPKGSTSKKPAEDNKSDDDDDDDATDSDE